MAQILPVQQVSHRIISTIMLNKVGITVRVTRKAHFLAIDDFKQLTVRLKKLTKQFGYKNITTPITMFMNRMKFRPSKRSLLQLNIQIYPRSAYTGCFELVSPLTVQRESDD